VGEEGWIGIAVVRCHWAGLRIAVGNTTPETCSLTLCAVPLQCRRSNSSTLPTSISCPA
jgi:hypothetical protein